HFAPGFIDSITDERASDTIGMRRELPCEASLDAGVAMVRAAVAIGNNPDDFVAVRFHAQRASDPAIAAGGDDAAVGLAALLFALLDQRISGASLPARPAFGVGERLVLSR